VKVPVASHRLRRHMLDPRCARRVYMLAKDLEAVFLKKVRQAERKPM
jgi:hypothetical protein